MSKQQTPCFLDFEASGLGHASYPIEVGWSWEDGRIEHWLIRPARHWHSWDTEAEQLHGISRVQLEREGQPVEVIVQRMNQVLKQHILYCDGGQFDHFWLHRLFRAAGQQTQFQLEDAAQVFEQYATPQQIEREVCSLRQQAYWLHHRHRVSCDVRFLQQLWQRIVEPQQYDGSESHGTASQQSAQRWYQVQRQQPCPAQ